MELDLNRVIRETASLVEHQFQKAGVATALDLAQDLPTIRGNSGKLQQVFLNLFINARDAMPGGGNLSVRSWAEGGFAHVEVADTGQGIPTENLARIYDPFFTTKGPKKGTGLGLSITTASCTSTTASSKWRACWSRARGSGWNFPACPCARRMRSERGAKL